MQKINLENSDLLTIYGGGQILACSGLDDHTDIATHLVGRTAFGAAGIDIKTPGQASLRFDTAPPRNCQITGDALELVVSSGMVRAVFLDNHHLLIEGPCEVTDVAGPIEIYETAGRVLVGVEGKLDRSKISTDVGRWFDRRRRWLQAQPIPEDLEPLRLATTAKALSVMKTQVCTPEGHVEHFWTTPDRWPHAGLWLWDSAFHAIGWRHIDAQLARDMISAVLDGQREDGQIPIRTLPKRQNEYTQPPVLTLAASLVDQVEHDPDWMVEIYPKLAAYIRWDLENRDSDGAGLLEWQIEGNVNCRSGESGMDNSPRFDAAKALDAVDFNSYLALECEILAEIAYRLGLDDEAEQWTETHQRLCDAINQRLWNQDAGLYVDCDAATGEQSGVLSSAGLLPLICGAPSARQAQQLAEHLQDPQMFATALPVPSIAACQTDIYSPDMWRGPVWINLNWLIALGLDRYDMTEQAAQLRLRSIEEIEKWYARTGAIFEFYDDKGVTPPPQLLRKGACDPDKHWTHQVIFDYGWSSTLYLDMLFTLHAPAEPDEA
ncbi:MAG: amylo-alpha-1,6-glucosidase [Phycisphaerae bacterium]